jgi:N4-gp56 family major capsid protein
MADYTTAVNRSEMNSGVLQTWLKREVLENFEPNLYFYKAGEQPSVESGYNTIGWAKFTQLDEDDVTEGTTEDDGVTPASIAFNATVITTTPVQYRVVISLSDLLIELNVINFLKGAAREVGAAMARRIDKEIQSVIMAGTYVIYGGGKTARTALGATDILTAALLNKANALLEARYAPKLNGFYMAYAHPYQIYDLRSESGTGNWLEVNKYTTPDKIFKGEIGMLSNIRIVMAPFVQKFSSTVDVYPCLVLGAGAYGVGTFQSMQTYITPATSSDSDPLAQRRKVGAKVAFGSRRLQEASMLRIETGVTSLV